MTKEYILEHVHYVMINAEQNQRLLSKVPHTYFLDMAAVYRVITGGCESFLVGRKLICMAGISAEELDEAARKNTFDQGNISLFRMDDELDFLAIIGGKAINHNADAYLRGDMYVLTNRHRFIGSGLVMNAELMEDICRKMHSWFYVLPSSIHEAIIVRDKEDIEPAVLAQIVREINLTKVSDEDFLSDSVYRFCEKTGLVKAV